MGKRYYCDYCYKHFQDNIKTRKRHSKSVSHQKNKKAYFDSMIIPIQHGGHYGSKSLLLGNHTGEDIFQIWLRDNPHVKRQHMDSIRVMNNIETTDSKGKTTADNTTTDADPRPKDGSGCVKGAESLDKSIKPFCPLNLLESLTTVDHRQLPPSLGGSGFEGITGTITEWG